MRNRVLRLIEGYAPGLRDKILAKAIISPTDLERLNPNLGEGDLNAGSMHLDQFYGQRPFLGRIAHATTGPLYVWCRHLAGWRRTAWFRRPAGAVASADISPPV